MEKLKIQSLSWAFDSLVKHDPWFSSTPFPSVCPTVLDLELNLAWSSGAPHSKTPEACLPVLTDSSPDCASEGPGRPEASSFPVQAPAWKDWELALQDSSKEKSPTPRFELCS